MTNDQQESVSLTTYRTFLANIGQVLVAFFVPYLAEIFSSSIGKAKGWQLTMTIIGIVGGLLLIGSFASTRERVRVPKKHAQMLSWLFKSRVVFVYGNLGDCSYHVFLHPPMVNFILQTLL
ncbi:MFS transporter [Pediococcus acidilactici]